MVAERWKIEAMLSLVKAVPFERLVVAGLSDPSSKTRQFIDRLGYRTYDVYEVLTALEVENYSSGPLRDVKGRPHDLWVFGSYIELYETYIKLAAFLSSQTVNAVCVSFHEAEHPLDYPYRKKEQT